MPLDQTLRRLTKMIASLSGDPRRLWQRATKRRFNIGFACGSRRAPPFSITRATVEVLATLGGTIDVTLYPYENATRRTARRRR